MTQEIKTEPKKRGRKRVNKRYFTDITEMAISAYNQTDNSHLRNKIYSRFIQYPMDKLTENMIHTFKFYHFDIPYEDVKHSAIAHVNEKIHKYKPSKGKAFSYFSRVVKNWLIANNKKAYEDKLRFDDVVVCDENRNVINEVVRDEYKNEMSDFINGWVKYWDNNMNKYFNKDRDILIADSIVELFRTCHNIEKYNKKALYILLRERTGSKTQHITKIIKFMNHSFEEMYLHYKQTGKIFFKHETDKKNQFFIY